MVDNDGLYSHQADGWDKKKFVLSLHTRSDPVCEMRAVTSRSDHVLDLTEGVVCEMGAVTSRGDHVLDLTEGIICEMGAVTSRGDHCEDIPSQYFTNEILHRCIQKILSHQQAEPL
jgi:hypothetical protein